MLAAWHSHEAELRAFLTARLGGDGERAEDLLQEAFLRALGAGPEFCSLRQPRAWLFRVARNALIDTRRRRRPTEGLPDDLAQAEPDDEPLAALGECVEQALAHLAPADQDVLRRCDLEQLPQQRYAELSRLSLPAVKARLRRARQRLRSRLERQCGVRFDETGRVCCHRADGTG